MEWELVEHSEQESVYLKCSYAQVDVSEVIFLLVCHRKVAEAGSGEKEQMGGRAAYCQSECPWE